MDDLNDIKQIWLTSNVNALPKAEEIVKIIRRHRLKLIAKNVALILFVILMVAVMCWVLFTYSPKLFVTRIGEACFFVALFILLGAGATSLIRATTFKNYTNEAYINFLKKEQQRQFSFQKTTQVIGFAFASIGLLLYLFELIYGNIMVLVIAYLLAIIWIAASWFIVRPISIRRKAKKLNETISKLERISAQLLNN